MKINCKKSVKICSVILALALLVSTAGMVCYAAGAGTTVTETQEGNGENEAVQLSTIGGGTAEKEETVYVIARSDGSAEKVIVSEWLKNFDNEDSINDYSELNDIQNVRGYETYTVEGDNTYVWNANGGDIYYQGTTEKSLPVEISVSYTLDGSPVSPEELAGKSGRVTIRFDYTNNQSEKVEIDGKEETVYVPFAVITGMILDNDTFRNIEVSNGKIINDGDRCVVMGFALPGMQESLAIDGDKLEIPSYFEVTADTDDFELTDTLTVVTNDIFSSIELDNVDSLDELEDSMAELDDAARQLLDGTSALYDGLTELLDKSGELISGIDTLYDGAGTIKNGTGTMAAGAAELDAGISELSMGLNALNENSASLTAGANMVFKSLLSTAGSQLAASGIEVPELTIENYKATLTYVLNSINESAAYDEAAASAGAASVEALITQLDSYNEFYQGVLAYTSGVSSASQGAGQLAEGSGQLKAGAASLNNGVSELYNGIGSLKDGSAALVDGVAQLKDGAMQLNEGMQEFYEEGIEKLTDALDGELDGLLSRLKVTMEASKDYQSFAGISHDMTGSVKFIYRTDAIQKAD